MKEMKILSLADVANMFLSLIKTPLNFLRACLHGGRGPQVGEVTRLSI